MVGIVLVDDHNLVRQGIRTMLEGHGYQILGEASDGLEAISLLEKVKPDILIVDLMMGNMNGLEVTRHILKTNPAIKVIVLSMYDDENYVVEALRAGAKGYVLKDASSEDLLRAISEVSTDHHFLSPSLSERAIDIYTRKMPLSLKDPYETLSHREREILHLIAAGTKNEDIAKRLFISRRTVEVHRANVKRKLGVSSRSDLVKLTQEHEQVRFPDSKQDVSVAASDFGN
ncbi:MAG: response regulator [Dehalogenimonas sp.]